MRLAFLPVLFALLLSGCGVKGPLYLPAEDKLPPSAKNTEAPAAPKPAAPQEKAQ